MSNRGTQTTLLLPSLSFPCQNPYNPRFTYTLFSAKTSCTSLPSQQGSKSKNAQIFPLESIYKSETRAERRRGGGGGAGLKKKHTEEETSSVSTSEAEQQPLLTAITHSHQFTPPLRFFSNTHRFLILQFPLPPFCNFQFRFHFHTSVRQSRSHLLPLPSHLAQVQSPASHTGKPHGTATLQRTATTTTISRCLGPAESPN